MRELLKKEVEKDETLELARSILDKAHPDAVNVIKHWISIIQSRWEEISSWALQVRIFECMMLQIYLFDCYCKLNDVTEQEKSCANCIYK